MAVLVVHLTTKCCFVHCIIITSKIEVLKTVGVSYKC